MALSCAFPPSPCVIEDTHTKAIVNDSAVCASQKDIFWGVPQMAPLCGIDIAHDKAVTFDEDSEKSTDISCDDSSQASESDDQSVDQISGQAIAEFLEQIGFSVLNELDSNGKSALHRAVKEGNAEVTRALLDEESFQHVNAKEKNILKWTVLHEASDAGDVQIVKMLMDHERFMHTNAKDRNRRTCLHLAASHGNLEMVKVILNNPRFASIGMKDTLGFTAQQRAKANGHDAIAQYIQACVPSRAPPGLRIEHMRSD